MDLQSVKESIVVNVYHIDSNRKVPLHKHPKHDEIFYCMKGKGFGVLEDGKVELTAGKAFIVPAGAMHSMEVDPDIYVSSLLIPVVDR
ncbi:MAG: cupin domain-containing protein [Desulfobacteria bacterium]